MKQSAVEWLYNNLLLNPITNEDIEYNQAVFENAKVLDAQQERSYSEEEVLDLLCARNIEFNLYEGRDKVEEWFEQFKKK